MRLLADVTFPKSILDLLRGAGHDIRCVRTDSPGSKDLDLLNIADREARIVLTVDKDFWPIAVQRRVPLNQGGVVLFRIHPAAAEKVKPLVRAFVEAGRACLGHDCTATTDGIQMVPSRCS